MKVGDFRMVRWLAQKVPLDVGPAWTALLGIHLQPNAMPSMYGMARWQWPVLFHGSPARLVSISVATPCACDLSTDIHTGMYR